MNTIPLVMGASGPVATTPSAILQTLTQNVASVAPDYTNDLPGSLIEDVSSTDVAAIAMLDQSRVDAINSVTPLGANVFVLSALGQMFGIAQGTPANASVELVFTGTVGFVIVPGFTVSDGTNQYVVQDGTVVGSNGSTPNTFAVASNPGTFPIPANSVTQIVTSIPGTVTLAVSNPVSGTPSVAAESVQSYRSRVMGAFLASATGTPALLTTMLTQIRAVTPRLVAIRALSGGWSVICGGGDPTAIASAILAAVPDISVLQGSTLAITGMTAANPVVISTNLDANLAVGQTFTVTGATPSAYNVTYTVGSINGTTITTTTDGSAFGTYTGGAIFNPNPRNITVTLYQNPNTYNVTFVNPPSQTVTMSVTWNTTQPNFAGGNIVAQNAAIALQAYINSIPVGSPINLLELQSTFTDSVATVIVPQNVTTLEFTVSINGVVVTPTAGTSIIPSDPESYFSCASGGVVVTQG